jgi:hypothetical protein
MSLTSHPQTCRCGLHAQISTSRQECYRQLAHAILGPVAPQEDLALARALAVHAQQLLPFNNVTRIRPRRVA